MTRVRFLVLLVLVLGAAFLWLALEAAEPEVFAVDYTVRAAVQAERGPSVTAVMHVLSDIGSGWVLVPLNVAIFAVLALRRQPRPWLIPAVTGGAVVLEAVTKWLVHRPRPKGAAYGFPSGHVTASVVFFGALVYVLWTAARPVPGRTALTLIAAGLVVGVAYSRLYFNAHWLSDVLGGVTGGGAYLGSCLAYREWRGARRAAPGVVAIALLVCLWPPAVAAAPSAPVTAADYVARGREEAAGGRYAAAAEDFTAALRLDPACVACYRGRADAELALGDNVAAVRDYTIVADREPGDADVRVQRGAAYMAGGHWAPAYADFDAAIRLGSRSPVAYANRAAVSLQMGSQYRTQARRDFERACALGLPLACERLREQPVN